MKSLAEETQVLTQQRADDASLIAQLKDSIAKLSDEDSARLQSHQGKSEDLSACKKTILKLQGEPRTIIAMISVLSSFLMS